MHVKFQQQFGDQPKDKEITVEFHSQLKELAESAEVEFPSILSVRGRQFSIGTANRIVLRIPMTRFLFVINVRFFQSAPVSVSALVSGSHVSGLKVQQSKIDFVEAHIVHAGWPSTTEQCTVTCANGIVERAWEHVLNALVPRVQ